MMIPTIKPLQNNQKNINKTLEGVLINNHVKEKEEVNFDEIKDMLLISEKNNETANKKNKKDDFNFLKASTPLLIGTAAAFLATGTISLVMKKGSKTILNSKSFEQLPDLALNMNIKQEPQFVMYRMLRDPSASNILGAVCVFLYSTIVLAAKHFTDGIKEIWVKKQQADIERDLQENLIDVEKQEFTGKLNIINNMLNDKANYFKNILNKDESPEIFFRKHFNFKGLEKDKDNIQKKQNKNENKEKKESLIYGGITLAGILGAFALGKYTSSNMKKVFNNAKDFTTKYTEKTIEAINQIASTKDKTKLEAIEDLFQSIAAKPEYITTTLSKMGIDDNTIEKVIKNVEKSKKTLFADTPTALGGIPKKIQYYCYLDEDRGHLYNWVTHPENKFTKYIFLSFSAITATSYLIQKIFETLKEIAVNRENSKTELNLKKRLIDVEIANFKAKKEGAIEPLMNSFDKKVKEGKSKQELKEYAQNILTEIKNGPPYVYS